LQLIQLPDLLALAKGATRAAGQEPQEAWLWRKSGQSALRMSK
jgi:hypothetical protein